MGTALEAIAKRSSTRSYTNEPLTEAEIRQIVTAGLQAPTAANRQEVHFTVVKGDNPILAELENEKNALRGIEAPAHNFYYEAPVVIMLSADSRNHWGSLDAGIAVENMSLAAEDLGLGSLIIGCIYDAFRGEKRDYFEKGFGFPEGWQYEIALAVGRKAAGKEPHTYDEEKLVNYL